MTDPRISFLSQTTGQETAVLLDVLKHTEIQIELSSAASGTAQVLCYQLSTLLTRLFDQVTLRGDQQAQTSPDVPFLTGPFLPALSAHLPTLRSRIPPSGVTRTLRVLIGAQGDPADLYLGSSAWGAHISALRPQTVENSGNTLGALAAGTLGASEVFKRVFGTQIRGMYTVPEWSLSLLDYRPVTGAEPELAGEVLLELTLFGVGSIGMGFLQGVALTPRASGQLTLVDNGQFDERNPVKYSLLDAESAARRERKAPWAKRRLTQLAGHRLSIGSAVATAQHHVATLPVSYRLPLVLSAVDTVEARLEIQDTLPGFIINAGIDGTLVEVSAHGFGQGACLACLAVKAELESWKAAPLAEATGLPHARVHALIQGNEGLQEEDLRLLRAAAKLPPEVLSDLDVYHGQPLLSLWNRVGYAETQVTLASHAQVSVSSAFVSAYAGLLLLAEAVKFSVPELRPFLVHTAYRQNLTGVPAEDFMVYPRDQTGTCLCHSAFRQRIYAEKYPKLDQHDRSNP